MRHYGLIRSKKQSNLSQKNDYPSSRDDADHRPLLVILSAGRCRDRPVRMAEPRYLRRDSHETGQSERGQLSDSAPGRPVSAGGCGVASTRHQGHQH